MVVKFPETNVVACIFCYRQSSNVPEGEYDEYDQMVAGRQAVAKKYYFRVPKALQGQLKLGCAAVVHCSQGFRLVKVVELNALAPASPDSLNPVISLVDLGLYESEIKVKQARAQLEARMEIAREKLEKAKLYQLLASEDPEFAKLLEEYNSLADLV